MHSSGVNIFKNRIDNLLVRAGYSKGHATRNDIVDNIVDFSSSTMAFNVAKIASARASLTISLTKSLRVAGPLDSYMWTRDKPTAS